MMNVIPRRSPKRGFQHGSQNLRMPSFAHYLLDSMQSLISYSLALSRAARSTTLDSRAMLCPTTAIPTLGCNRCHCFTLYNMLPTVDGMYHSVERSKAWAGAGSQCWTGSSVPQRAVARVIRVVWKSNHGTRRSGGLGSNASSLIFRGSVICEGGERRTMPPPRPPYPQYRIPKCAVRNGSRSKAPCPRRTLAWHP